ANAGAAPTQPATQPAPAHHTHAHTAAPSTPAPQASPAAAATAAPVEAAVITAPTGDLTQFNPHFTEDFLAKVKAMPADERYALINKDIETMTDAEVAIVQALQLGLVVDQSVPTTAEALADAETGGGATGFTMPFTRIKDQNWAVNKASMDARTYELMPVG